MVQTGDDAGQSLTSTGQGFGRDPGLDGHLSEAGPSIINAATPLYADTQW